jgi:polysaccharide export outer membrane protein
MKMTRRQASEFLGWCLVGGFCLTGVGCLTGGGAYVEKDAPIPRELRMTTLPPYVIEPPDILLIQTLRVIPKPPYHLQPLDGVYINLSNPLPDQPLRGQFGIDPDGTINLGDYGGLLRIAGMTVAQAEAAVRQRVGTIVKNPQIMVSLAFSRGMQNIQGIHLVRMDGTISMGTYGSVYITGMTIDQARRAIEQFLSQYLMDPEVSIDVYSYNSKWYYIISDRGGFGQTVFRLPITGRETVLDAMSFMFGVPFWGSPKHIWIARPNGQDPNCQQIFPVDWIALAKGGSPATNYQLMPGDRLFIGANPLIAASNKLNQFFAPIERVMGFTLLTTSVISSINGLVRALQGAVTTTTTTGPAGTPIP